MTPERQARIEHVLKHRQPNITVVLENITDPHNISAVMRSCDAIGIQEIFVLNYKIARHKKWGARSSSSAAKWLTINEFDSLQDCINVLKNKYQKIFTTHLTADSKGLYDLNLTQSIALVFGNEHSGVSDEMRTAADGNFIIPQVGMIHSLNISVACAVTLYEAFRQKNIAGHYAQQNLPDEQIKSLRTSWGIYDEKTDH